MSTPALQQALALHRAPRSPRPGVVDRLPAGMIHLIRLAAGEESSTQQAQHATGEPPDVLREAACFYVQQVMFAPDADSFRILGVDRDAEDELLKEHYRWLVRWLHPDRNPDQWEAVYADRVNRAWQDLRTLERRQRYQRELEDIDVLEPEVQAAASHGVKLAKAADAAEPGTGINLRWVPTAIFVGLGVVAFGFVAMFSALHLAGDEAAVANAPAAAAEPLAREESRPARVVENPVASPALVAPPALDPVPPPAEAIAAAEPAVDVPQPAPMSTTPAPMQATMTTAPEIAPKRAPEPAAPPRPTRSVPPAPPTVAARIARPAAVAAARTVAPPDPILAPVAARAPAMARAEVRPVPGVEPVAPAAPAAPVVDPRVANRLLGNFSDAYGRGDLDGMRRLFAEDVQGSQGGLSEILADYDQLFAKSDRRSLSVHDVSWFSSGDTLTVVASYRATVSGTREGRARKTRGDLRLDLRKVNEEWRIYRFQHGERPG